MVKVKAHKRKTTGSKVFGVETSGPIEGFFKLNTPVPMIVIIGPDKYKRGYIIGKIRTDPDVDDPETGEWQYAIKLKNGKITYLGSNEIDIGLY